MLKEREPGEPVGNLLGERQTIFEMEKPETPKFLLLKMPINIENCQPVKFGFNKILTDFFWSYQKWSNVKGVLKIIKTKK